MLTFSGVFGRKKDGLRHDSDSDSESLMIGWLDGLMMVGGLI